MKNKIISSLPPLQPVSVVDVSTGEVVSLAEHAVAANSLLDFVVESVQKYPKVSLESKLLEDKRRVAPAEWARSNGFKLDTSLLPRDVKAKSRVEKLFQHKLVTECKSFVENPNPLKKPPNFGPKINFGAVDTQMIPSFALEGNSLYITIKMWDREFELVFAVPEYVLEKNISKWSKPTLERRRGTLYYIFSVQETCSVRAESDQYAGLDLGRVEPYHLVVQNKSGARVADYKAPGRLKQLNTKRERILLEKKHTGSKANSYDELGLDSSVLRQQSKHLASKAARLGVSVALETGAAVTKQLSKHPVQVLALENLKWAVGSQYGSRWTHSKTQDAIEHATERKGIRVKKVNPKNTSQECHKCGSRVVHNARTRIALCSSCKEQFDRDFNAAMNIARKVNTRHPVRQSRNGDICSEVNTSQDIVFNTHAREYKKLL